MHDSGASHRFQTPEDIDLEYDIAGPGTRFVAFVWDQVLLGFFLFGTLVLLTVISLTISEDIMGGILIALVIVWFGFGQFLYFTAYEISTSGSSYGKKRCGLQVVTRGGYPLTPRTSLLRNVFRLIDTLPVLWLIPLFSKSHRRLGDMAADTLVVRIRSEVEVELGFTDRNYDSLQHRILELTRTELTKYGADDLQMLEQYMGRRASLSTAASDRVETQLLKELVLKRLDRTALPQSPKSKMLEELYLAIKDHGRF